MGGMGTALVLSIIIALVIPSSFAIPYPDNTKTVSIQLSQSCIAMIKANITTTCPSYEQLYLLGLDDSLPGTGDFGYNKEGYFERGPSQYHDVHELYRFYDNHVIVDPPAGVATRSNLIVIAPDIPPYVPLGEYEKVDHKRVLEKDRYVDPQCEYATITSKNWSDLLADTIYYLRNDCTHTVFDTRMIIEDHISSMDFTTSQKYKHDKWVAESIENCKTQLCKEY